MPQFSRKFQEYTTLILSFLISSTFYRRKDLTYAEIRRIAVIKLDHIGDVILSIPAIANLRAHFPRAHICMIANSSSRLIASYIPHLDEILCYDARFFDRSGSLRMLDFPRGLRFARDMRKRDFDLIVDLRGSFASLLYGVIAESRFRIDRGTYLIQRKLGRTSLKSEHEAEVNLDMLARAGVPTPLRDLSLDLPQEYKDSADVLLGNYNQRLPIIAVHPGGPSLIKRWPAERYAQLADHLSREHNARIILVGGKGEERIAGSILSRMDENATDLSGQTRLGQLAAVLQKADLFIGNDSGPMHLAAACGTRVIGLFGPTSPQRFGPYGEHCAALRMEKDCLPCMQDKCKRPGYRCIDRISVDDVTILARRMMSLS